MFFYVDIYAGLAQTPLAPHMENLRGRINNTLDVSRHSDLNKWGEVLYSLPPVYPSSIVLNAATVRIGMREDCNDMVRVQIEQVLRELHPWRKGPFDFFDIYIDTEWRSDWKWERLRTHISSLQGRHVLDIGCGNGYYCWRMAGEGAHSVTGIDPTLIYIMQYLAARVYCKEIPVYILPLGVDDLPDNIGTYDTVFSMGVLYHRRSPLDHLLQLRSFLRPEGELVLETLVIEGEEERVLLPRDRYAKMRNVWFIPSCDTLRVWLERCGFCDIRIVDTGETHTAEQRSTDWMRFESLADFLDPADHGKTIEGYPAPRRAVAIATNMC